MIAYFCGSVFSFLMLKEEKQVRVFLTLTLEIKTEKNTKGNWMDETYEDWVVAKASVKRHLKI